jgi:hypothetical protein
VVRQEFMVCLALGNIKCGSWKLVHEAQMNSSESMSLVLALLTFDHGEDF